MCGGFLTMQGVIVASVICAISLGLRQSGLLVPNYPIVETADGQVRGFMSVSRDGRSYSSYIGIPYAEPPIGKLRFEAPLPAKSWNGVREANRYSPECYQYDALVYGKFMGDEDCLYLNVYSPSKPNDTVLLPVIVWIHGGGFISGSADMYDPGYFMDEDVVVVSMNYRLGPLGFLNTGDNLIRGNMGLKDQNLALRWVNKNIHNFGGDKLNVLIIGESAGGASVHYHIVSPASKGLFHKAIIMSGAVTCPWSLTNNPRHQALRFGKIVNCSNENTEVLTKCLKNLNVKQLFTPMIDFMNNAPMTAQEDMMVPSVEAVVEKDTFLAENPRILIEQGIFTHVPVMMGVTSGEGGIRTSRLEINEPVLESMDEKWNYYCPLLENYDPQRTDISEKIRKQYFSSTKRFSDDRDGFLKNFTIMMSDSLFYHAIHKAATFHSKKAPVYMYFYDYKSNLPSIYSMLKAVKPDDWLFAKLKAAVSISKDMFKKYFGYPGPYEYGACHADDLLQLWNMEWLFEIGARSNDYTFSKAFIKSLVNFAGKEKTLEFNGISWPPIDSNSPELYKYMRLDKEGKVIDEPFGKRLPFWDSLNIRNPRETTNW